MKRVGLVMAIFCAVIQTQAQSSQVKVYLQQIAANQVLIEYIRKGYRIARRGLTTIGNIKNGEFNLHRDFFTSLRQINPRIKNTAKIADIINCQIRIIKTWQTNYRLIKDSEQFTDEEIDYIYSVFISLLDDTAVVLEELLKVITAGKYQMSDDERINRIDELYSEMQSRYSFAEHFGNDAMLLVVNRIREKQDVESSRALRGIPPGP